MIGNETKGSLPGHLRELLVFCSRCKASVAVDLKNAGATWVDEPVARDGNIITLRKPADLPIFNKAIIEALI